MASAAAEIPALWMERALESPALIVPTAADAGLESRLLPIAECGDGVLGVVNKRLLPSE